MPTRITGHAARWLAMLVVFQIGGAPEADWKPWPAAAEPMAATDETPEPIVALVVNKTDYVCPACERFKREAPSFGFTVEEVESSWNPHQLDPVIRFKTARGWRAVFGWDGAATAATIRRDLQSSPAVMSAPAATAEPRRATIKAVRVTVGPATSVRPVTFPRLTRVRWSVNGSWNPSRETLIRHLRGAHGAGGYDLEGMDRASLLNLHDWIHGGRRGP